MLIKRNVQQARYPCATCSRPPCHGHPPTPPPRPLLWGGQTPPLSQLLPPRPPARGGSRPPFPAAAAISWGIRPPHQLLQRWLLYRPRAAQTVQSFRSENSPNFEEEKRNSDHGKRMSYLSAVQPVLVKFKLASEAFSNSLRRSARTFLFSTDPENCKSTRFAP